MISATCLLVAGALAVSAIPLLLRMNAPARSGLGRRVTVEAGRLALAAAAIAVLVTLAARSR